MKKLARSNPYSSETETAYPADVKILFQACREKRICQIWIECFGQGGLTLIKVLLRIQQSRGNSKPTYHYAEYWLTACENIQELRTVWTFFLYQSCSIIPFLCNNKKGGLLWSFGKRLHWAPLLCKFACVSPPSPHFYGCPSVFKSPHWEWRGFKSRRRNKSWCWDLFNMQQRNLPNAYKFNSFFLLIPIITKVCLKLLYYLVIWHNMAQFCYSIENQIRQLQLVAFQREIPFKMKSIPFQVYSPALWWRL